MQIIILGADAVGAMLAETLAQESHDVTVIGQRHEELRELQDRLDIRTVVGRPSYPDVLRQAGAEQADMIIAVTLNDEINMVACQVAYSLFDIPTKIASVRSPHYFIRKQLFGREDLPIDIFISPEQLVIESIEELVHHPGALQVLNFVGGKVKLVAVKPYYGGLFVGKPLSELNQYLPGVKTRVAAIFRDDRSIPLVGSTVIEVGDEVFLVAASEHIETIISAMRRQDKPTKKVAIAGGGNLGYGLADILEHDYQVTVIDHDKGRCQFITEELKKSRIIFGDVTDDYLLKKEELISEVDVFCAVTNDDEINIMSCIQAKKLGVRQVMALIMRPAYVDLIEGSPITVAISPQMATVGSILAHVRGGDVVSVHALRRGAAEAIEIKVSGDPKTSRVIDRQIKDLGLAKSISIGAIVRDDDVIIPNGNTTIKLGDHAIIFVSDKYYLKEVEKLFHTPEKSFFWRKFLGAR